MSAATVSPGPGDSKQDPVMQRLDDQIDWYDRKSRSAQRIFKNSKIVEILAAALIPFMAGMKFQYHEVVTGGLGVLITILEGFLHLNQYQQIWSTYRSTCEALKHEKYLYLAGAGRYDGVSNPRALLAEQIEALVSQEHTQWSSIQQQGQKAANSDREFTGGLK